MSDIPPVQPIVTEYPVHRLVGPACGAEHRAGVPVGVPMGGLGPHLEAITARRKL